MSSWIRDGARSGSLIARARQLAQHSTHSRIRLPDFADVQMYEARFPRGQPQQSVPGSNDSRLMRRIVSYQEAA